LKLRSKFILKNLIFFNSKLNGRKLEFNALINCRALLVHWRCFSGDVAPSLQEKNLLLFDLRNIFAFTESYIVAAILHLRFCNTLNKIPSVNLIVVAFSCSSAINKNL